MRAGLAARRVLACFPHPDDESFAAGGLLAACAARGAAVQILCATRGEAGVDRRGRANAGPALAVQRSAELAAACAALGAAPPAFLDLPDGRLAELDRIRLAALLADELRQRSPDLIVTFGADGAYGHRDHLAWTAVVSAAAANAVSSARLLHAVFPRQLFTPLCRALQPLGVVGEIDPASLGVGAGEAELRLDARPYVAAKRAALAAHVSQLAVGAPLSLLRPSRMEPLLDEEWFVVAAGAPLPRGAADPFAAL
jgi:N-acetyl-1-D-myo-inositol-2-amino-2-deoxy-alpha-D-glucopyranoside deacetylase